MSLDSNSYLFIGARLHVAPGRSEQGWLRTQGAQIVALGVGELPSVPTDATVIDTHGRHLLPGFIDVHVHGAVDADTMDDDPRSLPNMARFFARCGVTSFLATTWSASHDDTLRALHRIADAAIPRDGAQLLGAHLEGPYFNPKFCGAQDPRVIRRAAHAEFTEYLDVGVIRLLSLAPEYEENLALLDECMRRGISVSLAHSGATYDQARRAIERGLRHSTHTFNAMSAFNHREPGAVGALLTAPSVVCELIADGIHVHPAAMRLLTQAVGPERVVLISDAMRAAGMPDGDYPVDDRVVTVRDGRAMLSDGTLAGSVLTMDAALRRFIAATGLPLERAWPAASLNAARDIGVAGRKGALAAGMDADLVLLDDDLQVNTTMVQGVIAFSVASPEAQPRS